MTSRAPRESGPGERLYMPALRYAVLTRLYDPVVGTTLRERTFKRRLLRQAALAPGHEVLDLGCGTDTLALLLCELHPGVQVTGIDGDPSILEIANRKAKQAGVEVRFERGLAQDLPFSNGSFDRVVSSLFFHHLPPPSKIDAAREIARVLKPGGELHVVDWGRATGPLMRAAFLGIQLLDGFANTRDHVRGRLPDVFRQAGLQDVSVRGSMPTLFGSLGFYAARREDVSGHP